MQNAIMTAYAALATKVNIAQAGSPPIVDSLPNIKGQGDVAANRTRLRMPKVFGVMGFV